MLNVMHVIVLIVMCYACYSVNCCMFACHSLNLGVSDTTLPLEIIFGNYFWKLFLNNVSTLTLKSLLFKKYD